MDINDKHEVFKPYTAPCPKCRLNFDSIGFTCDAFPGGIPDIILAGENKHLAPITGQENELVFTPKG